LRREVERLLVSLAEADDFLEEPAVDKTRGSPGHDLYLDRQVGAYRLVERIGRGGMGVVYLATRSDDVFEKKVAIKLLPASGASEELVRRFRSERQILARLEHPNIARLLDGGTTATSNPRTCWSRPTACPNCSTSASPSSSNPSSRPRRQRGRAQRLRDPRAGGLLYFDRGNTAAAESLVQEARDILAELFEPGDERLEATEELLREIEAARARLGQASFAG